MTGLRKILFIILFICFFSAVIFRIASSFWIIPGLSIIVRDIIVYGLLVIYSILGYIIVSSEDNKKK